MSKLPKYVGFHDAGRVGLGAFDNTRPDPKTGELKPVPSMTKQEFVQECDINNIIKSYRVTGQIAHMRSNAAIGSYEDLPDPIDYQDAMQIMLNAQTAFSTLPSAVRNRFENDPQQFLAFMANPQNAEEIVNLGLATKRPQPAPVQGSGGSPGSPGAAGGTPPAPSQENAPKGS